MATSSQGAIHTSCWVGDHSHGLLIYIYGNLYTLISQCDSATWGDDSVGSTSLIISFHQDGHYLVEPFNSINYH
jgi:hypothetical protein